MASDHSDVAHKLNAIKQLLMPLQAYCETPVKHTWLLLKFTYLLCSSELL